MKPILILKTGQAPQAIIDKRGDFESWIVASAGLEPDYTLTVSVYLEEALPPLDTISAMIITGSPAMVTDNADWIKRTEKYLTTAMDQGMPVLGICFGHQLIAQTLGGKVDWHPEGREIGTTMVSLTESAGTDSLFASLPKAFPVHATHMQTVTALPEGAHILAHNAFEPHHAVRFGQAVWGLQFHPEFDGDIMTSYIRERAAAIQEEGFDLDFLLSEVSEAPESQSILERFIVLVKSR